MNIIEQNIGDPKSKQPTLPALKLDYKKVQPFDKELIKKMIKKEILNTKNVQRSVMNNSKDPFFTLYQDEDGKSLDKPVSPSFIPSPTMTKSKKSKFSQVTVKQKKISPRKLYNSILNEV